MTDPVAIGAMMATMIAAIAAATVSIFNAIAAERRATRVEQRLLATEITVATKVSTTAATLANKVHETTAALASKMEAVHIVVNGQREAMLAEIAALKQTILDSKNRDS